MNLCVIAAVANNDAIGKAGKLPWHIPEDLAKFKQLTLGCAIVSGRRTFAETGILPERTHFVVSSQPPGDIRAHWTSSLTDAITQAQQRGYTKLIVIGGELLYREAMVIADELHITRVNTVVEDADAFFPTDLLDGNPLKWKLVSQSRTLGEFPLTYNFEHYVRRMSC